MTSPENMRFYEDTMRYAREAAAGRAAASGADFLLPVGFPFGVPSGVDADTLRAAREAAATAQARGFVEEATRLARDARISLPDEAGLAAQLAAARRFLGPARGARASAEAISRDFAETLARAGELFADPNFRRMLESVDAGSVVAQGLEIAEEALEEAEEELTAEEIDVLLGPDGDVEMLIPWVNYACIIFGVAWLVATGSPEFLEYKEPLEDMLTRLATLRAALEEYLKKRDQ